MKMKSRTVLILVGVFLTVAALTLFWFGKVNDAELNFCLSPEPLPEEVNWSGPIKVGGDWVALPAPTILKSSPHGQELWLLANTELYELDSVPEQSAVDFDLKSFWYLNGGFRQIETGERAVFEVRIEDESGKEVQLIQTAVAHDTTGPKPRPALIFDLYHPNWKKRVFHPDFRGAKLYVKASKNVMLDSVKWRTSGFHRNPCKQWADIEPEQIFNFDETPPPGRP